MPARALKLARRAAIAPELSGAAIGGAPENSGILENPAGARRWKGPLEGFAGGFCWRVLLEGPVGAGDEIRTHDPNLGKVMLYP